MLTVDTPLAIPSSVFFPWRLLCFSAFLTLHLLHDVCVNLGIIIQGIMAKERASLSFSPHTYKLGLSDFIVWNCINSG
jgi:hypothetical protein